MTYIEFKKQQYEKLNNLPIFYAFNKEQFEKGMAEKGVKLEDVFDMGAGAYCDKKNVKLIDEAFDSSKILVKLLENTKFFEEALKYELWNHEFSYTGDPRDAMEVLSITKDDIKKHADNGSELAKKILKYL